MSDPIHETIREASRATPALDRLLDALKRKITTLVWMHGMGTVLGVGAAWLFFAFAADWMLHLPAPIRVMHLIVLIALPLVFLVRELWRPLGKRPRKDGLAVLVERAHPELAQLLVSAVQFRESP